MESDVITLQDIFVAKPPEEDENTNGKPLRLLAELDSTGLKPHFLEKMASNGVSLPPTFFSDTSSFRPNYQAATYGGFE